jgi:hypothetical protein
VLGVGDGITDDVLKEDLEDSPGLLVDEAGDTLNSSPAGQAPDGGLGDSLDVVPQDFAMPLGSALSESFSSFTASCWLREWWWWWWERMGKYTRRGEEERVSLVEVADMVV